MPPPIKKYSKKLVGELRRSQLLTTYGSGALADFPRFSGIIAGLDDWKIDELPESAKINEKNLEIMLGKNCFYQVSSPDEGLYKSFSLPTYRFPSWYYCPECNSLDYYTKIAKSTSGNTSDYNSALVCNKCSDSVKQVRLIPSRFVMACANGHISDFPYVWWVHRKTGNCENPKLFLKYNGTTGGLDSIHVYCATCKADTSMEGCMDKKALKMLKCQGEMPWLGFDNKHWYRDPKNCDAVPRCLQRSANNVYYSKNKSALTIPPWSAKIQKVLKSKNSLFEDIFDDNDDEEIKKGLEKQFNKHPELYGGNLSLFIKAAYARYRDIPEGKNEKDLRREEYAAFCGTDVDDDVFRTETIDLPELMKPYFTNIKLVKKLREVMVIEGFRRILPSVPANQDDDFGTINTEHAPLSRAPLDWLPAIELFGEGIFFELNEAKVSEWENKWKDRYETMSKRHVDKWIAEGMFEDNSPRYVLIHTLAHLMIRQLTAQCGYATASLKEKIYSTIENDKMCGFLIYTSATDTDGSLGGLVREGRPDRIVNTFENMLQESSWCSNDPLCIDSLSQGYKGLNYAACHACTLLPETSCESLNCLLDRAAVVGTPDEKAIGYFSELL